jgi:hypothetical protein
MAIEIGLELAKNVTSRPKIVKIHCKGVNSKSKVKATKEI